MWSLVSASSLAFALTFASTAYAEDPYIQLSGSSGISTGYRMKGGISRVEVDFALTETAGSAQTWIFGSDNMETVLKTFCYFTGSGVGSGITFRVRGGEYIATPVGDPDLASKTGDRGWGHTADTDRRTFIVDLKNGRDVIVTGTTTNLNASFSPSLLTGLVSDLPLSIFAKFNNANATTFASSVKGKIYGVKIYENYDMASADNSSHLVHNFVPCLKDGETPCFKDLVGGGFIIGENVEAFSAGGDNVPTYVSTVSETPGEYFYIDTGYKVKDSTRVELDCALASNMVGTASWALFDAYNSARFRFYWPANSTSALWCWVGTGNTAVSLGNSAFPPPKKGREVRRTFILDAANTLASVVTSSFTNSADSVSDTFASYGSGGDSLKLASAYFVNNTLEKTLLAPLKIYGCRIYEDGQLVHDFAPYVMYDFETSTAKAGLQDGVTGVFVSGRVKTESAYGANVSLPYGGAIRGEQDAYIESNGSLGMNTGYCMTGAVSRVEVDFQLVDTNTVASKYVYGCSGSPENTLRTFFYFTGTSVPTFRTGDADTQNANSAQWVVLADADRHIAATDLKNKKCVINPYPSNAASSSTKVTEKAFGNDFAGKIADCPLSIFGAFNSYNAATAVATYKNCVKARIYSVRFYENYVEDGDNTPVRELIPYSRGGVVGFYDTVTGEIVKNDNAAAGAFTFGGAGTDHGELKAYLKPGYATKVTKHESQAKTLTAYAPGANSYRWYRDGQLIDDDGNGVADGADGVLPITWARGGTKTNEGFRHTYQAIAVFDDFYGVERESEPTAEAQVTSVYVGTMLSIK